MTTKAREKAERQQRKQAPRAASVRKPGASVRQGARTARMPLVARRLRVPRAVRSRAPSARGASRALRLPSGPASNRKPRPSKPRDERPASAPGDKPAARKPQVKRRPKPAGDGMRPGFRR